MKKLARSEIKLKPDTFDGFIDEKFLMKVYDAYEKLLEAYECLSPVEETDNPFKKYKMKEKFKNFDSEGNPYEAFQYSFAIDSLDDIFRLVYSILRLNEESILKFAYAYEVFKKKSGKGKDFQIDDLKDFGNLVMQSSVEKYLLRRFFS